MPDCPPEMTPGRRPGTGVDRALGDARPLHPYALGACGPNGAVSLSARHSRWRSPGAPKSDR
jgi:hypothetical protein